MCPVMYDVRPCHASVSRRDIPFSTEKEKELSYMNSNFVGSIEKCMIFLIKTHIFYSSISSKNSENWPVPSLDMDISPIALRFVKGVI